MVRTPYVAAAAVIITALAVGGTWYYLLEPPSSPSIDVLEIYHWWTSDREAAALRGLVLYFNTQYRYTMVRQRQIVGEKGYVPLVLAGEAPDSFPLHAGYEVRPYYDEGYLDSVTSLFRDQGWEGVLPGVVLDMVKFGNDYYAVPLGIHRSNLIWFNREVLTVHGIDPTTLTTWDAFFAACDKLVAEGIRTPIYLANADKWVAGYVFEQILASEGIGFYQDFVNGKITSPTDPKLLDALTKFKKYLGYVNSDHASRVWSKAIEYVVIGASAFTVMGDWADEVFVRLNREGTVRYGPFYGAFPVPGTVGYYGIVMECFLRPVGARHSDSSLRWLRVVGSEEGQDAFNVLKGTISPRSDSNITKYGPYQKAARADFVAAAHLYPSFVNGTGAPQSFTSELDEIMSAFVTDQDINAAATALTNAVVAAKDDFVKTWSL